MNIRAGDLVMVVGGACEHATDHGMLYIVQSIEPGPSECWLCRYKHPGRTWRSGPTALLDGRYGKPLSWLRRIPPPEELNICSEDEWLPETSS